MSGKDTVKNRILKTQLVKWSELKDLQPEDSKVITNFADIKQSIEKHGFAQPFFVWQDRDGLIYTIDGHTRRNVLCEFENVPDELPATFIDAKDRKEAIEILIEVYNQKHNPFDIKVLEEFIQIEGVDVDIDTVNIQKMEIDEDYGTDFKLPEGDKQPFQQMTFTLADEQAVQINNAINDIKQTDEFKYCETMGNENSNGNALYLIIMQWAGQRK